MATRCIGWSGSSPRCRQLAGQREHRAGYPRLVPRRRPAALVAQLEVDLRAQDGPDEVELRPVHRPSEDAPQAVPMLVAPRLLQVGAPPGDLGVAGGGVAHGAPDPRRAADRLTL